MQKATVKEQLEEEVQRTANDDEKYRQMLGDYRARIEQVRQALRIIRGCQLIATT